MLAWATGVWDGTPDLDTMQAALRRAIARLSRLRRPWFGATDAAATFLLTLLRLGLSPPVRQAPHNQRWHEDRLRGGFAADRGLLGRPGNHGAVRQFSTLGELTRPAFLAGNPTLVGLWEAGGMVPLAPKCACQVGFPQHLDTGQALKAPRLGGQPLPALPRRARHDVSPLLRVPGLARRADAFSSHNAGNSSCVVVSRVLPQFCRWRQWAGQAVVAVDDLENLKSAACGTLPIDVLPEQTSRDGEDYAVAMAGPITMDPLTLHIACAGTTATIRRPRRRGRGPMSGAGCLAPTTRSRQSRSRAARRRWTCRRGVPLADVFSKKAADTPKLRLRVARTVLALALTALGKQAARWAAEAHVVLHAPGWDDTLAAP